MQLHLRMIKSKAQETEIATKLHCSADSEIHCKGRAGWSLRVLAGLRFQDLAAGCARVLDTFNRLASNSVLYQN
jgi:hypothetical protein